MDSSKPLVSFIMPTYNQADYVEECVDSIINQHYQNWELIIVDDGSTDNTQDILVKYQSNAKIHILQQENAGQASAKNKALSAAKGMYVAVLDSDNICTEDRLDIAVTFLEANPNIVMCHGDIIEIDEAGKQITSKNMPRYSDKAVDNLLRDNFIAINTAVFRRDAMLDVGGFDASVRRADDLEFCLRFCAKYAINYIAEFMCLYRVTTTQISQDTIGRFKSNEQIYLNFYKRFKLELPDVAWRRGFSFFYCRRGRHEYALGYKSEALKSFLKGLIWHPFWQGPYRSFLASVLRRERT